MRIDYIKLYLLVYLYKTQNNILVDIKQIEIMYTYYS